MAIYHLTIKRGTRASGQSAVAKSNYIERDGKYAKGKKELLYSESGNMPEFAQQNHKDFWKSADAFERQNAQLFREIEFALPVELSTEQQIELVKAFKAYVCDDDRLPYTLAIHKGKFDHQGKRTSTPENPHCHLIFSDRGLDGIERSAEQFFKRANKANPEKGGNAKIRKYKSQEWLIEARETWAKLANQALEKVGHEARIDHRTLEAQGITDRAPQKHRGIAGHMYQRGVDTVRDADRRELVREQRKIRHQKAEQRAEEAQESAEIAKLTAERKEAESELKQLEARLEREKRAGMQQKPPYEMQNRKKTEDKAEIEAIYPRDEVFKTHEIEKDDHLAEIEQALDQAEKQEQEAQLALAKQEAQKEQAQQTEKQTEAEIARVQGQIEALESKFFAKMRHGDKIEQLHEQLTDLKASQTETRKKASKLDEKATNCQKAINHAQEQKNRLKGEIDRIYDAKTPSAFTITFRDRPKEGIKKRAIKGYTAHTRRSGTVEYRNNTTNKTELVEQYSQVSVKIATLESIMQALKIAEAKFGKNQFEVRGAPPEQIKLIREAVNRTGIVVSANNERIAPTIRLDVSKEIATREVAKCAYKAMEGEIENLPEIKKQLANQGYNLGVTPEMLKDKKGYEVQELFIKNTKATPEKQQEIRERTRGRGGFSR